MLTTQGDTPVNKEKEKEEEEATRQTSGDKKEEKVEVKSDDSDSDYDDKSVMVIKKGRTKTYNSIPFNYDRLSSSSQSTSVN